MNSSRLNALLQNPGQSRLPISSKEITLDYGAFSSPLQRDAEDIVVRERDKVLHPVALGRLLKREAKDRTANFIPRTVQNSLNELPDDHTTSFFLKSHSVLRLKDMNAQGKKLKSRDSIMYKPPSVQKTLGLVKLDEGNYTLGYSAPVSRDASVDHHPPRDSKHASNAKIRLTKHMGPWVMARNKALKKESTPSSKQHLVEDRDSAVATPKKLGGLDIFKVNENHEARHIKKMAHLISSLEFEQPLAFNADLFDKDHRRPVVKKPQSQAASPVKNKENLHEPATDQKRRNSSKHKIFMRDGIMRQEPLNRMREHAVIGSTYPSLLYDCNILKRNKLTESEKKKWNLMISQGPSQFKKMVQEECKTDEIMESAKQLMRIHRKGNIAQKISFSTEVLKASIDKKLAPLMANIENRKPATTHGDPRVSSFDVGRLASLEPLHGKGDTDSSRQSPGAAAIRTEIARSSPTKPKKTAWDFFEHVQLRKLPETELKANSKWKLLRSFLLYIVRNGLTDLIDGLFDCEFFVKPYGYEGSLDTFMAVKKGDLEEVREILEVKKKKLLLFCYDTVDLAHLRQERLRCTGQSRGPTCRWSS